MYWIFAAILILITLTVPRLRPASIAGLVVLAVLLVWAMVQQRRETNAQQPQLHERSVPTSPGAQLIAMPPDSVVIENLQLSGGGAPFELRGRIGNTTSDARLKSVTIQITRRDCYEGALDPTGCAVLWQDRHWMPLSIAPGETREFETSIWARGSAPRPRGEVQDSFELIAATGEAVAR